MKVSCIVLSNARGTIENLNKLIKEKYGEWNMVDLQC